MKKGAGGLEFQRDTLGGSPVQVAPHKMARLSEESGGKGALAEGAGAAVVPGGGSSSAGFLASSGGGGLPVLPPFPFGPGVAAPGSPFPVDLGAAAVVDGTSVEVPGVSVEDPGGSFPDTGPGRRWRWRSGRRRRWWCSSTSSW